MKQPYSFSTGDPSYLVAASTSGRVKPTALTVSNGSVGGFFAVRRFMAHKADSNHSRGGQSPSTVDSHRSTASASHRAARFTQKTHEPVLERPDQVFGSKALDDVCLREPVSQSLTLRIPHDGPCLQENGHDTGSGKQQQQVSPDRTGQRGGKAGLEVNHNQAEKELPNALTFDPVTQQKVRRAKGQVPNEVRLPVEDNRCHDQKAVNGCGNQPRSCVSFRIWRHQASRKARENWKVHNCEHGRRENEEAGNA